MTKALHYAVAATLLAVTIDPAIAGSYLDVVDCKGGLESDPTVGCFPGVPAVQHPSCGALHNRMASSRDKSKAKSSI